MFSTAIAMRGGVRRSSPQESWPVIFRVRLGTVSIGLEYYFFFSSRRRHTRSLCDWSSDVCSSDLGPRTPERDAGRRVVVPFLRDQGVGRVAVVVATHGDADHLGGLPAVVEAFPPELVLEPGEPLGRPLYLEFLAGVEASGARWHGARAGDRVEVDSVVLEVLSPDSLWLRLDRKSTR